MKRLLFVITVAITGLSICKAQTAAEVAKNINKVKRDTMYIYAESTT